MKLRVVDIRAWINGTNDDPKGETYFELPESWDSLDDGQRGDWITEQIASLEYPEETRILYELGDFVDGVWAAVAVPSQMMAIGTTDRFEVPR